MSKAYLALALSLLLLVPQLVHADQPSYVVGEYILETDESTMRTNKELKLLEEYSGLKLQIVDTHKYTTLIATKEVLNKENQEISNTRNRDDVCLLARARKREVLRKLLDTKRIAKVRTIDCEPNQVVSMTRTANDTYQSLQWAVKNSVEGYDMRLENAWDKTTGSRNVIVAVIDSGVDYTHPDLQANMWRNPNEIASNGIDDDANGVIDDMYGYNAASNTGNPMDDNGHGTHVAGTIGATGNNGLGLVGVNWQVKIIGVKFLEANGNGDLNNALKSIDYVTALKRNKGINIVATNNSWGGGSYSSFLFNAIERAKQQDILFIAAAGNSSQNMEQTPSYPASYSNSNIISVGAVKRDGTLASFSNYGATQVDVGAPGVTIASTYTGNRYVYLDGTSMAAPHVTGLIALAKSFSLQSTGAQLQQALYSSISPISGLTGSMRFPGLINANAMLNVLDAQPPSSTPVAAPAPTTAPTIAPTTTSTPTATATPTNTPTPMPGYYAMQVQVKNSLNENISSALVEIRTSNGKVYYSMTNQNGLASVNQILGPVTYTLKAIKPGFVFSNQQGTINANISRTVVASSNLNYPLNIKVLNSQKLPISGHKINLGSLGNLQTNSQGLASIMLPVNTLYSLSVDDSDYSFGYSAASGEVLGATTRLFIANN